jgi:hypothetical protein
MITYKGFKLISLELIGNDLLGTIKYNFFEEADKEDQIYTTVIIGPNGTGKSNALRIVIELFRELYLLSRTEERFYNVKGRYSLKYAINEWVYEFTNFVREPDNEVPIEFTELNFDVKKQQKFLLLNGEKIDFKKAVFPEAIIANSIMVTDKFLFSDKENFKIYEYQGIRDKPQGASTASYVRKTVERVVNNSVDSFAFINGLREIKNEFSHSDHNPYITYRTQNTGLFFGKDFNGQALDRYFMAMDAKYLESGKRPPNKLPYYQNYVKDNTSLIGEIVEFCITLKSTGRLNHIKNSSAKFIAYELLNSSDIETLKKEYKLIEHLRNLGIIYQPEIEFLKLSKSNLLEGYSIEESSSGEFHLFSSFVGFMASMKMHSLILIDEPEISLHPNWQMKYLTFLRRLFRDENYANSHVVVATHSHFLISDLPGETSKIIGLKKEDGVIGLLEIPKEVNTYGWSAEDVLYNIFNVASTRNKFVAEDIGKILNQLAATNKDAENKIPTDTYEKLIQLKQSLKESDPLKVVVNKILDRVIV